MQQKNLLAMLSLFIVLIIDGLGQGILFPLLTKTLVAPHSTALIQHGSEHLRTFLYSTILGVYFLCWFFGSVIMGDMSDAVGRKKALVICMLGAGLSYFITALSFIFHSLTLIFISRIIGGLTAGSQPIAQAAIVDMSSKDTLTRNISYIMFSVCLGLILGPLVGSFLTNSHLVSWFGNTTPLYLGAIFSLVNCAILLGFFRDKAQQTGKVKLKFSKAISLLTEAYKDKKIRHLSAIYFLYQTSWVGFYIYCSVYITKLFHFTIYQTGIFLGLIGVGWGLGFMLLLPLCKRFRAKTNIILGYGAIGLVALIMVLIPKEIVAWIIVVPGTAGTAVAISYTISTYSSLVGTNKQGWIMGVSTAVAVLAGAFSVLLVGVVAGFSLSAPMIASFIFMILGALVCLSFKIKKLQPTEINESIDPIA